MKQLVKITPMEPYAFGTDQKFQYPGEESTGKESYFVKSRTMPEQTTILGMLRFLLLKQKGLLHSDFKYNEDEIKRMAQYIGPESFQFEKEKQEFGCIHRISPVFLIDNRGNYYVKNPFHNTEKEKGYTPIAISEKLIETSFGNIRLPEKDEFRAKDGHAVGFYNLSDGSIHKELFKSVIIPGNRKNNKTSDDDCFFKRELFVLKRGYCFAVFVDADEVFHTDIVSMGMGGCTFLISSELGREDDLEKHVKEAFTGDNKEVWMYALSDLVVQCRPQQQYLGRDNKQNVYETFCIVEQKQMRNLETKYNERGRLQKLKRRKSQINMIRSGSVFFQSCGLNLYNENCMQIGYNRIVKLGGNYHAGSDV